VRDDRRVAHAGISRGTEPMRKIGLEPAVERFDILELG